MQNCSKLFKITDVSTEPMSLVCRGALFSLFSFLLTVVFVRVGGGSSVIRAQTSCVNFKV